MDETLLAKWVQYLASGKGYASASCDFAEMIWQEAVTQQQQIQLLRTGNANVCRAVASAVTGRGSDCDSMRYLINECFNDDDDGVRRHVWWAICHAQYVNCDQKLLLVEKLAEEHDEVVLGFVHDIRSTCQT